MDKYIYFAAELPMLKWPEAPPMSLSAFHEEARKWMTKTDYEQLSHALLNRYKDTQSSDILGNYLAFEYQLRTELAAYRSAKRENYEYKFKHIPMSLVKDANPLEAEKNLLKYRWDWLDEQGFGHYSDADFFILYYLKLQILQQLEVFSEESGKEAFRALVEQENEQNAEADEASA